MRIVKGDLLSCGPRKVLANELQVVLNNAVLFSGHYQLSDQESMGDNLSDDGSFG
jgi:hypothetical protein